MKQKILFLLCFKERRSEEEREKNRIAIPLNQMQFYLKNENRGEMVIPFPPTKHALKVKFVAKGFKQKEVIDYFDTYTLVARIKSIRTLIALALIYKLHIHQTDVKTIFLNGDLKEEVYMEQPEGFILLKNEKKVCKLVKSLYGLKRAPKQWHEKFNSSILSYDFKHNGVDKCVYSKFIKNYGVVVRPCQARLKDGIVPSGTTKLNRALN
ncbi:Reverse transcriptase [Theobroma cacao]|nr:Reverse transcriptase [Theobroma cacao]